MHYLTVFASLLLLSSFACGGSEKPLATPSAQTEVAVAAEGHIAIVPMVMTTTRVKADGTKELSRIIRISAEGVMSVEEDGVSKDVSTVGSNGVFAVLDDPETSLRVDENGTFHLNGKAIPQMRVDEDGTLHVQTKTDSELKPYLRIEDGKVIDAEGLLNSSFSFTGETQVTKYEITVEGGDQARHLAGIVLGTMLLPGKDEVSFSEETSDGIPAEAPEPVVAPTTP